MNDAHRPKRKERRRIFLSLFVIFCVMVGCTTPPLKDRKEDTAAAEATGRCIKCHSAGEVDVGDAFTMHTIHFAALAEEAQCAMCHPTEPQGTPKVSKESNGRPIYVTAETAAKVSPYYLSWATSDFLDNQHNQNQVDCAGCHDDALRPKNPPMEQCFKCHGSYAEVAKLPYSTMNNPHDSHMGEIECTLCHKGHADFEFYCNECHQFDDISDNN